MIEEANNLYFILNAIRNSFCLKESLPSTDSTNQVIDSIKRNGIVLTVYNSLPPIMQADLKVYYYGAIEQAITQDYEGKRIMSALSEAGIDCIALKGWEIRNLYPNSNMRQMADVDILVRPYNPDIINNVMRKSGFDGGNSADTGWMHDSFYKERITVEIHKRLTDDSGDIQAWENEMWTHAVKVSDHIFKMKQEDFCIYHFIHLYKDFLNGSLGLRRIIDTWLLQKEQIDMQIVKNFLTGIGIWDFCERMIYLSKATMGEVEIDANAGILLKHAMNFGIYGTDKSYKTGRIAAMGKDLKKGKKHSLFRAVFLPISRMKAQYPILKRYPVLLPWYWIKRIISFINKDIKRYLKKLDYSNIKESDYYEMKQFFEAGGIESSSNS